MNAKIRTAILLSCSTTVPMMVMAQSRNETTTPPGAIEEIVITAQKRVERLADVPVAASVLSPDVLGAANAGDIADLNNLVPSVNLNATLNGRVPLGIRGISSNANQATVGLASGVAIMRDGVPIPSDAYAANQMEDVKSVEVLKGPQATLGGRTASAGVINVVTRGPSRTLQGSVSATLTDDDEYRGNFFIAGPMSDKVAYSLSAYGNSREYPITNIKTDDQTKQESYGARGKLLFSPSDTLDITVAAGYGKQKSDGANLIYTYITPGAHLLGIPVPWLEAGFLNPGITPSWENDQYISPVTDSGSDIEDYDGLLNIDYQIGDATLSSTTAYLHETVSSIQDLFATDTYWWNTTIQNLGIPAPPFFNFQKLDYTIKQFSEELKLASSTDRTFSYLVGAFFSDGRVEFTQVRDFLPADTDYTAEPVTKTLGIYGRTTWKFRPSTSLVTGLRYNYDDISYKFDQRLYVVAFPTAIYPNLYSEGSSSSSTVVGDISLQQKFGADVMGYATYARGYAPEVYNTAKALLPDANGNAIEKDPVGKTDIDHFELGLKGLYLDRTVSLNVSVFDTIYKNYQIQFYSSTPGVPAPVLELSNAGKAETRGLEADLVWQTDSGFRLNASAAYIDAKFKEYDNAPCWVGQQAVDPSCTADSTGSFVQDVSGDQMPNSPKFKGVLGLEQQFDVGSTGYTMTLGGQYTYRDKAQMLPDQNPLAVMDSYGLLNLQVSLQSPNDRWSVTLFGNNVTDEFYAGDVEDFWSGPWSSNNVIMQPARDAKRYFGLRFEANMF